MFRHIIEKAIPLVTFLTAVSSLVPSVGQIVSGLRTSSLLLCISALFSVGMALAKFFSFKGMRGTNDKNEQLCYYRKIGIIILVSGVFFVVCSLYMFIGERLTQYPLTMAIAINSSTMAGAILNVCGLAFAGRSKNLLLKANSLIGLAASFICFVLTQTVFRANLYPGRDVLLENKFYGVFLGFCAALIGLYMIIGSYASKRKKPEESCRESIPKRFLEEVYE